MLKTIVILHFFGVVLSVCAHTHWWQRLLFVRFTLIVFQFQMALLRFQWGRQYLRVANRCFVDTVRMAWRQIDFVKKSYRKNLQDFFSFLEGKKLLRW